MRARVTAATLGALVALAPPALFAHTADTAAPPTPGPSAASAGTAPATPEQAQELARQAILLETRPQRRIVWVWQAKPKPPKEAKQRDLKWLDALFEALEPALKPLAKAWVWALRHGAELIRQLALLGLAVGLGLFLVHGRRLELWWAGRSATAAAPPPDILFGLDLRPESLPEEPDAAARALFAGGRPREALALLYRAALSRCVHRWDMPLSAAMTELECARRVGREMARRGEEARGGVFRRLTAGWIRAAYAHENVAEARFLELARDWREAFG